MNYGPGLAVMALMFPTAIIAGILGWWALRRTPTRRGALVLAYAILLSPVFLSVLADPAEGLQLALHVALQTLITPIVGFALMTATIRKRNAVNEHPDN